MSADPDVDPDEESTTRSWTPVDVATDEAPAYFLADPPEQLTGPSSARFEARAKSPHGRSRTGVRLIDESPPPAGHSVTGRRPLIAVVDTVISAHPWLGDESDPEPFWFTPGPDEQWKAPELPPGSSDPTARAYGHGTFIAGIVRQLAPESRVLSLPVMGDDGYAETGVVLDTLEWLLARVRKAREPGQSELFVDVVNLSFGWYRGKDDTEFPAEKHRELLDGLAAEGVRVVASAGNRSTTKPVYPAAFADELVGSTPTPTPLLSVGALDPDGTLAAYSNDGDWVTALAPGTGLISTVPPVRGVSWSDPSLEQEGCRHPNPNHLARGFARWGGTSFAAAWVSARIAGHLLHDSSGPELTDVSPEAAHTRAASAWAATVAEPEIRLRGKNAPS